MITLNFIIKLENKIFRTHKRFLLFNLGHLKDTKYQVFWKLPLFTLSQAGTQTSPLPPPKLIAIPEKLE